MSRFNNPWPDENIDQLKEMHAAGKSFGDIAKTIGGGHSRNSCIGKARRLGLVHTKAPISTWDKAKPLNNKIARGRNVGSEASKLMTAIRRKAPPVNEIASIRALATDVPDSKPSRLLDLHPWACRYPLGGPTERAEWFCGAVAIGHQSYCPTHYCRAYIPRSAQRNPA